MNVDLNTLRLGNDPRSFSDFSALKSELDKRFHPARPDIDWARAHGLCLSLFNQNGADLQTAAWFVVIRQHQLGFNGLNEGLTLLQTLLSQYWQNIWPQQTHARIEILSSLSQQLIAGLRSSTPVYSDLSALYQAEATLSKIGQQLQTLELKHLSQFERLQDLLTTYARQLENADSPDYGYVPSTPLQPLHIPKTAPSHSNNSYKNSVSIKTNATLTPHQEHKNKKKTRSFGQGMGLGLIVGLIIAGGASTAFYYTVIHPNLKSEMVQVLPNIPQFSDKTALLLTQNIETKDKNTRELSSEKLTEINSYLQYLESISPIWPQEYGTDLLGYLNKSYPNNQEISAFNQKWQQDIQINAISTEKLNQWSEGMAQLNNLSVRLDNLDGKPRSYITGSELKTIMFNARQHFNQGLPLEEELRRLEILQSEGNVADSEYQRIDNHFKQLLNRYALLRKGDLK